jgi:hypothetical protein
MDVNNQPHVRTALTWGNSLQCQWNRRVCGLQSLCGRLEKAYLISLTEFESRGPPNCNLAAIKTALPRLPATTQKLCTSIPPFFEVPFRRVAYKQKSPVRFVMSSAHMHQHGSNGRIFVIFDFGDLKLDKNIEHFK